MESKMEPDKELKEETLKSSVAYRGKILTVKEKEVRLPDGRLGRREVVEHPGAVALVAVGKNREIYLVEQYRSPMEKVLLELPAGKLDPGETPEDAALRELQEETGMRAGRLLPLAAFYSSPGYSSEKIHLFLALDLTETGEAPDPGEFLRVKTLPARQVLDLVTRGEVEDGKTILGVALALNLYNEFI